jgi:coproporphyrinogen III oxidase-like Fe-S oxidoreductase
MNTLLTKEEIDLLEICGKEINMDLITELTYEEQQIFLKHAVDLLLLNPENEKVNTGTALTNEEINVLEIYGREINMDLMTDLIYDEQKIFLQYAIDLFLLTET